MIPGLKDERLQSLVPLLADIVRYDSSLMSSPADSPAAQPRRRSSLPDLSAKKSTEPVPAPLLEPKRPSTPNSNAARAGSPEFGSRLTKAPRKSSGMFSEDSFTAALVGQTRQTNLFEILTALVLASVENTEQPLVIVVDDAQFVDESSLKYLDSLLKQAQSSDGCDTISVLSMSRTGVPEALTTPLKADITLGPLEEPAMADIVKDVAGVPDTDKVDSDVLQSISESSSGSPLFCKEVRVKRVREKKRELSDPPPSSSPRRRLGSGSAGSCLSSRTDGSASQKAEAPRPRPPGRTPSSLPSRCCKTS